MEIRDDYEIFKNLSPRRLNCLILVIELKLIRQGNEKNICTEAIKIMRKEAFKCFSLIPFTLVLASLKFALTFNYFLDMINYTIYIV